MELPFGQGFEEIMFHSWYPILFVLLFSLGYWFRSYMRGAQVISNVSMKGKTVVVTGANSGIGRETAKELAIRGARVIMACRDEEKGKEAAQKLQTLTRNKNIIPMKLDLCSFKSIREFAVAFTKKEDRLDVLINNAGVIMPPQNKTDDGFDLQMQTNYLGPFLLTHLLLNHLKNCSPSRVVNVTAVAFTLGKLNLDDINHESVEDYQTGDMYAQSKLALTMFNKTLAKKLEGTGVTVNAIHPGVVKTDGHRYMGYYTSTFVKMSLMPLIWLVMKTPVDGAQAAVECAIQENLEKVSGKYFVDFNEKKVENAEYDDEDLCDKLYEKSLEWTKFES
ncbi:retinol dehydrogenase 13-like [Lineus longissimus]|uniref:retinol dehydrogenase 13-like n=1 Tax=Lineus longissimus TaxID=88925 RepID=UPI002B4CF8AA